MHRVPGGLPHEAGLTRPTARDAAFAALSGRIRIADGCDRTPEAVLDDLLAQLWPADAEQPPGLDSDADADSDDAEQPDGQGKADGPPPPAAGQADAVRSSSQSSLRRERHSGQSRRTVSRAELASRHASFESASPQAGELDPEAIGQLLAQDPDAAAALLADLSQATDPQLRAIARRLAARVFIQFGAAGRQSARGPRRIRSVPGGDGDVDLDRTLDRLSGQWPPAGADLVTRSWQARRRSVCLLVDASGSMSGLALAMAAVATSSVLLAADGRLDTGALAFSGQVTVLQPPGSRQQPEVIVGRLLGLRGHGLTDLAAGLRAAAVLLAAGPSAERCAILLSDCLSTAGGDPAAALAGIDRLDVVCPQPEGAEPEAGSLAAAQRLARLGGGLCVPVRTVSELPAALTRLLAGR